MLQMRTVIIIMLMNFLFYFLLDLTGIEDPLSESEGSESSDDSETDFEDEEDVQVNHISNDFNVSIIYNKGTNL